MQDRLCATNRRLFPKKRRLSTTRFVKQKDTFGTEQNRKKGATERPGYGLFSTNNIIKTRYSYVGGDVSSFRLHPHLDVRPG